MDIPSAARGCARLARIPVNEKSSGPCTLKDTQPFSIFIALVSPCSELGTIRSGHTSESSSDVLVMDRKHAVDDGDKIQEGTVLVGGRRITASFSFFATASTSFMADEDILEDSNDMVLERCSSIRISRARASSRKGKESPKTTQYYVEVVYNT